MTFRLSIVHHLSRQICQDAFCFLGETENNQRTRLRQIQKGTSLNQLTFLLTEIEVQNLGKRVCKGYYPYDIVVYTYGKFAPIAMKQMKDSKIASISRTER